MTDLQNTNPKKFFHVRQVHHPSCLPRKQICGSMRFFIHQRPKSEKKLFSLPSPPSSLTPFFSPLTSFRRKNKPPTFPSSPPVNINTLFSTPTKPFSNPVFSYRQNPHACRRKRDGGFCYDRDPSQTPPPESLLFPTATLPLRLLIPALAFHPLSFPTSGQFISHRTPLACTLNLLAVTGLSRIEQNAA